MNLNLENVSYDGRWFEFDDVRLKIRPYPASKMSFMIKDGNAIIAGEYGLEKFMYCLMAWEWLDAEKKAAELTKEVKQKIYDFRLGKATIDGEEISLSDFVTNKADELFIEASANQKN